jgi:hypothetical protein
VGLPGDQSSRLALCSSKYSGSVVITARWHHAVIDLVSRRREPLSCGHVLGYTHHQGPGNAGAGHTPWAPCRPE